MYWIRSRQHGDPLKNFRFDLNKNRAVAYDLFQSEQLYDEVERNLNAQIVRTGKDPIDHKIAEIRAESSYLDNYSQLSPLERNNIKDANLMPVRELIEKEIRFMTD